MAGKLGSCHWPPGHPYSPAHFPGGLRGLLGTGCPLWGVEGAILSCSLIAVPGRRHVGCVEDTAAVGRRGSVQPLRAF